MNAANLQVSVVTASLEALSELKKAIDSVRMQKNVSLEHIIVDGDSCDGTPAWLAENGSDLVWKSEKDEGIADAMNKGKSLANGDWLLFLQADDCLLAENSLESALGEWDGESDIIACSIKYNSGRVLGPRCEKGYFRYFKQGILHQGALIRRSAFERIGDYDSNFLIAMDFDWFLRAHWADLRVQVNPIVITEMGEAGISFRKDWQNLSFRFREEQKARLLRAPGIAWKLLYSLYWPIYYLTRRIGHIISPV